MSTFQPHPPLFGRRVCSCLIPLSLARINRTGLQFILILPWDQVLDPCLWQENEKKKKRKKEETKNTPSLSFSIYSNPSYLVSMHLIYFFFSLHFIPALGTSGTSLRSISNPTKDSRARFPSRRAAVRFARPDAGYTT